MIHIDKDSSNQEWRHCKSIKYSDDGLRWYRHNNIVIILSWTLCLIVMNQNAVLTFAFSINMVKPKRSPKKSSWQGTRGALGSKNIRPIMNDVGEEENKFSLYNDDDISTLGIELYNNNNNDMDAEKSTVGLYIHIPFCRRRCRYCDFAIVPIGDDAATDDGSSRQRDGFLKMETSYKDAILKEIEIIRQSNPNPKKIPLRSIYFGGGTPSLASIETLKEILDSILVDPQSPFVNPFFNEEQTQNSLEITIEIDPGTFSLSKLQSLKHLGFNRLSLGVQSFDDNILERIGRFHRFNDIQCSIEMIKEVYGEDNANYSIDLISGLPGLSLAKWAETLETAVSLSPQPSHLSLYDLQIESGTVFGKWYKQHLIDDGDEGENEDMNGLRISPVKEPEPIITQHNDLPSAIDCAFMYKYASGYLKSKKYEHYEISSYALCSPKSPQTHKTSNISEKRSRHNQIYWEIDSSWYAIGLGATSRINGKRYARPRNMSDYISWLNKEQKRLNADANDYVAPWISVNTEYDITKDDDEKLDTLLDIIMTRLRTKEGLDLTWIKTEYGPKCVDAILKGAKLGLDLDLAETDSNTLRLIDPSGFLFSNNILSSIFLEIYNIT